MKKTALIITLLFTIGLFAPLKAANNSATKLMITKKDCAQIAFDLQGDLEANGVDMATANEVAALVYEICVVQE